MKKRENLSLPAIGGASLLVIFGVLCLVILALLSLNTALAERRLAQAHARREAEWYAADLEAQEIFALLRAGEPVPGLERSSSEYHYGVPISDHRSLLVTVNETEAGWEVRSWQTIAHPEDGDTALPVWQGPEGVEPYA